MIKLIPCTEIPETWPQFRHLIDGFLFHSCETTVEVWDKGNFQIANIMEELEEHKVDFPKKKTSISCL